MERNAGIWDGGKQGTTAHDAVGVLYGSLCRNFAKYCYHRFENSVFVDLFHS